MVAGHICDRAVPPRRLHDGDFGLRERGRYHLGNVRLGRTLPQIRTSEAHKIKDVTLEKIGYQTDNGAFYCTCTGNCSDKLLRVTSSLSEQGVPLGWLSFQGAGASSGNPPPHIPNAAPWCVDELGFDDPGGMGKNYPMPLGPFQKALGIPLQLYAPYVG